MTVDEAAKRIWDYMHMGHELTQADALFVLSSHDPRVPHYAAQLYHEGWAPLVLIAGSGKGHKNDLMATDYGMGEGEYFYQILKEAGVPEGVMLLETQSTNTGQNFEFMGNLLDTRGLDPRTIICVQKPYMQRRVYATGKVWWPERELVITSPPLSYEENLDGSDKPKDAVISIMVGDLERIREYPTRGYQIEQDVPEDVWAAWEFLVEQGYDKHRIGDSHLR